MAEEMSDCDAGTLCGSQLLCERSSKAWLSSSSLFSSRGPIAPLLSLSKLLDQLLYTTECWKGRPVMLMPSSLCLFFYYTATNISNNTVLTNNARKLPLVCDWTGLAWRQRHGFNDLLIFLSAPRLYYHLVNLRVFCFYP